MMSLLTLLIIQLGVPAWFTLSLWRRKDWTARDWWLTLAAGTAYHLFAYLIPPWGFVPYPLRFVVPGLFAVAALRSGLRLRAVGASDSPTPKHQTSPIWCLLLVAYFGYQCVQALLG